ncbi:hypothetical protein pb186bvf_008994 [Paramecium bursaria]
MNGINITILSQYIKCIKLFNNFNIKDKMSTSIQFLIEYKQLL